MKQQLLVSVGREHGSGGHYIAQLIADQLQIRLLDREIVEGTILESGYSRELVTKMDEKPVNFFSSRRIGSYSNSLEENVAEKTFEFIRNTAASGESFVVVGRCAEYILRGNPNLVSLFICGDLDEKIRRVAERAKVSEARAAELIRETDRRRKLYHNYYCDNKWGDARGYDMTVNSSKLGIEQTAAALVRYIRAFQAE